MNMESKTPSPPAPVARFGLSALIGVALLSAALSSAATWAIGHSGTHWFESSAQGEQDARPYQCPMHPTIVQDHPGDCPICGMKLVQMPAATPQPNTSAASSHRPAIEGPAKSPAPGNSAAPATPGLVLVEVDPERQQLIGMRTAPVTQGTVGGSWRTVGRVAIDETHVRHVNLKVPGYVERIYVDYVGKKVHRGDPLFSLYSPELLSAQQEFLLAQRTERELAKVGGGVAKSESGLLAAARRKLELWDIPSAAIDAIAQSGEPTKTLTLYSPASGVVTKKDVVEGMKLEAGAMPYEIVDLSSVWVLADVYESELRFVKENMVGNLTLAAFPNREFQGKVVFVDPLLDPDSRTVKVRLSFPNPSGDLRPGMFGEVLLSGVPREGLRIPTDAVIDSGTEKIVFVALGNGKFEPRQVKLGETGGDNVEVLDGLRLGDQVVTRANFLVDSESRLRASLAEVSAGAASRKAPESARVLPAPAAIAPSPSGLPAAHQGH